MNEQPVTPISYPDPIIPLEVAKTYAAALSKHLGNESSRFRASYPGPAIASINQDIDLRLQKEIQEEIERVVLKTLCKDCTFP